MTQNHFPPQPPKIFQHQKKFILFLTLTLITLSVQAEISAKSGFKLVSEKLQSISNSQKSELDLSSNSLVENNVLNEVGKDFSAAELLKTSTKVNEKLDTKLKSNFQHKKNNVWKACSSWAFYDGNDDVQEFRDVEELDWERSSFLEGNRNGI